MLIPSVSKLAFLRHEAVFVNVFSYLYRRPDKNMKLMLFRENKEYIFQRSNEYSFKVKYKFNLGEVVRFSWI